jgi:hypothetical protein
MIARCEVSFKAASAIKKHHASGSIADMTGRVMVILEAPPEIVHRIESGEAEFIRGELMVIYATLE